MRKTVLLIALFGLAACQRQDSRQLVEGLASGDGVACFAALRQDDSSRCRAAIISGTAHRSARVRSQCARLLGLSQDISTVTNLQAMLTDPDLGVRQQAARALVPLLDSDELVELLKSQQLPVVARAAIVSAMLRDPAELTETGFLDWLLDRSHPAQMRVFLYRALRDSHAPCYGDARGEAKLKPVVEQARRRIAEQVRADVHNRAEPVEVRAAALPLLAALAQGQAVAEILAVFESRDSGPRLREAAILALGCTRQPQALATLGPVASDPNLPLSLRLGAVGGLSGLGNQDAAQALRSLLSDSDPRIRAKTATALYAIRDQSALEPLRQALEQELDDDAQRSLRWAVRGLENSSKVNNTCQPCP